MERYTSPFPCSEYPWRWPRYVEVSLQRYPAAGTVGFADSSLASCAVAMCCHASHASGRCVGASAPPQVSICKLSKFVISQFHLKMHKLVKQEKELVAKLGESEAGRMRTNLIAGAVPIPRAGPLTARGIRAVATRCGPTARSAALHCGFDSARRHCLGSVRLAAVCASVSACSACTRPALPTCTATLGSTAPIKTAD